MNYKDFPKEHSLLIQIPSLTVSSSPTAPNSPTRSRVATSKTTLKILVIFMIFGFSISANSLKAESEIHDSKKQNFTPHNNLEDYLFIQHVVQSIISKPNSKTQALELEVKIQAEKIKNLEKEILQLRQPEENSVATILLTAVSVIITTLAVLIAVLAIPGYRNIKNKAIKEAQKTAKETVKNVAKEEIPKATEENIIKLINENRFDKLIENAVENIVYRDTTMLDDMIDEENPN
ncbi:hypothetical protein [Pseudomonas sp. B707]|jgi:hypothetical protein|uniref:hypothetical protein n=1 Tax=Pseudomonas sp. B707 TaxID=2689570 RepID=UPI001F0CFA43|nr:hypothetical protein [Pseudomonas sp. B707]MCH4899369.1 hypothetical protein [Pseudomonas sp. B707]